MLPVQALRSQPAPAAWRPVPSSLVFDLTGVALAQDFEERGLEGEVGHERQDQA